MSEFTNNLYFLQSGGQMGQLLRSKNWSTTALESPTQWPLSLRSTVATIINNPVARSIAWGKEYVQLYNDSFKTILDQANRNCGLAIPFQETFPDIFHLIEEKFEGVMKGELHKITKVILSKDTTSFIENPTFNFSISPIWMDNQVVGGVLITVTETIDEEKLEKPLKINANRFKSIADGMPNLSWS